MNKQSIISRWLSLLLLMMLTGVGSTWAQMLSIADFSMAAGDTKEVTVSLTPNASQKIYGIQADISVSEGLSLTEVVSAQKKLDVFKNASSTKLVQFSLSGAEIAAGEVIKLTVEAAKSFTGGTIKIENMRFTDDNTTGHELVVDGIAVANVTLEESGQWTWHDFAVNLTNAEAIPTTATQFGVKVAEDGSYSATTTDDETANFTVNAARFNDKQHGWVNCVFTVPVNGPVKIELGDCQFGGQNGTITDAQGNQTDIKANAAKACWSANDPHKNVVVAYYAGTEPTTLTISYNGYCPFIAMTSIDLSEIPNEATVTFDVANAGAEGVAPTEKKVEIGAKVTIPANTTLYKDGYTLTAWTDGTAEYAAGSEVTVNEDMTLLPVFTANTVSFADRTAETTITWQFGESNGVGTLNAQGKSTILVAQATIGNDVIDVKMDIDATNGKINNVGRGDKWAQCNDGTILTIPAYKGTAVSFDSYGDGSGTTIGGVEAADKAATYNGTAETLDIVANGIGYIASVTAVYPVPSQEEPSSWVDIKADFTNGSFFTAEEKENVISAGLKMNADGTFTRVAADDATANAVISGKYHSDQHGLANFSATVAVEGPVKVSMGSCAWGGDVTIKDATGATVGTFNTNNGACWSNNKPEENVLFTYYKGEATTLTISGGSYTPYFAVEKVDPSEIPSDCQISFDVANAGAEGVAPANVTAEMGSKFTIPQNFTLYKEGMTLTAWTDGQNTYPVGQEITVPNEETMTLLPVFTQNEVSLNDRTEAVTVKFDFQRKNGAPTVAYQNATGIWVAQATIGNSTIDVKADFDTNNGGKFANGNWNDWAQLNGGTKWTIPSAKGAVVSMEAFGEITTTTIDGQTDYTTGKTISYTIAGSAETVDVVIGDGSYYRYIQVVLPVVQSQGGESFDNVEGTIVWAVGNEANGTVSADIANAVQNATWSAGSDLKVEAAKYFDTDMVKYTPANSNEGDVEGVMIEYRVKMAAGITFKPTSVSYDAVKVGTDGATYSWGYAVDGNASTITEVDAATTLRNNGANSATAQLNHVLDMSNAGEGNIFAMRFYISKTANNKNICIGNVIISGTVNGTAQSVNLYTLATAVAPNEEAGSINVYPVADQYEEGSDVKLTATESFGYDFVNWTDAEGAVVSEEPVFTYTMNGDATLTANFVAVETYELALTVDGTNDYMVTVSPEPTVVDDKWMYEAGTAVQLTANQYDGLVTFTNWSDGETSTSKLISMTENTEVTALYAQADIIAGWDFYKAGGSGRKADFFAQDNDGDALNLVNTATGETSGWLDKSTVGAGGYESFKGAAVNWRSGESDGDVGNWHWQTKVNAEAFSDINVQFQMLYNYNAYKTYNAEYSLDGENWTKFGSITMDGAKNVASFSEQLPAEANNQKDLYIRMLADKENSSVDGAASKNDGNTLAMFFITGTPKIVDDGTAPVLVSTVPANNAEGVSATGRIVLTFDERVKLADNAKGLMSLANGTMGAWQVEPTVSGKTVTFEYKGLEYNTNYNFSMAANTISDLTDNYMTDAIELSFTTMARPTVDKKLYDKVVDNVEDLLAAIAAAQARTDKNTRYRIFIKNGEYTIPVDQTKLVAKAEGYEVPECITFINTDNLSIIGESRDGVIITNGIDPSATFAGTYGTTSKYDGIGNSDVFQLSGQGYYWQDLTVETGMADATGRDLAIHDKGTKNIYKNVGLRGYQDTWTSNNDYGLYYFEGGYVRGRTDYMCGKGDIFWNGVELRQIYGGYAAVPSKPAKYGWIYKDCIINGEPGLASGKTYTAAQVDGNYTLGRPWGSGTPIALFIDTEMNVVPSAIGWNEMSGGWPARFAEYNSMTSTGSQIDLSGRKTMFGAHKENGVDMPATHPNNPVLTAEEALENSDMSRMYGDWQPALATEQAPIVTNVTLSGNTLSWKGSDYALLYAICKDGAVVGFTTDTEFDVSTLDTPASVRGQVAAASSYSVRAANEMGGLNEQSDPASIVDAISEVAPAVVTTDTPAYNTAGQRVDRSYKGIVIKNGKKVVMKQK